MDNDSSSCGFSSDYRRPYGSDSVSQRSQQRNGIHHPSIYFDYRRHNANTISEQVQNALCKEEHPNIEARSEFVH